MNFNITPEELRKLLEERQQDQSRAQVRLIDVREPEEFEICALPEAELCPMSEFSQHQEELMAGEDTIVVYCHHGIRSAGVVNQLRYLGRNKVLNLAGGIDRWSTEIDPELPRYGTERNTVVIRCIQAFSPLSTGRVDQGSLFPPSYFDQVQRRGNQIFLKKLRSFLDRLPFMG